MTSIIASAPGSLMISGEHAVVYGYPAIVCAIAQRVAVTLSSRDDGHIYIHSALGDYHARAGLLHADARLRFVLACLERYPTSGALTLHIESALDPTLGLGSSAAVTVATLAALAQYTAADASLPALHEQALAIIRSLQGRGSGADLAASLWGGMIAYQNQPQVSVTPLPLPPDPLSLRYAGYKTPTGEVLARIAARMQEHPEHYAALYAQMGDTSTRTIAAAQAQDWPTFYRLLTTYQQHMRALGVSDATLEQLIADALPHSHATKISGSGLGDCILAFTAHTPPAHQPVEIDTQGIIIKF